MKERATMATKLWRGNTGSSVLDLQQKLNRNGYSLDEDGVFGSNTYNAVLDYQRKNNLAVDGVVGDETWGSLNRTTVGPAGLPCHPSSRVKPCSLPQYSKIPPAHKFPQTGAI